MEKRQAAGYLHCVSIYLREAEASLRRRQASLGQNDSKLSFCSSLVEIKTSLMTNYNPMKNTKKTLIIVIAVLAIIAAGVVVVIIYYASGGNKTAEEKYYEEKSKVIEEITNQSGKELENKEESIANIKSIVSEVMAGNNIQGKPYLFKNESDRRMSEQEEYFSLVGFWADEHEITTNYETKVLEDLNSIKLKCAELFKALYQEENKVYYAKCEAYQSDDDLRPVWSVLLEREGAEQVNWNKDVIALVADELLSAWHIDRDDFWLYE